MNKRNLDNLPHHISQSHHLSLEEKANLRASLLEYILAYPPQERPTTSSLWLIRRHTWSISFAVVLMFLVTIGSVSYAAEFSLPGETLYGVKVNLTEPLRGTLQTSLEDQAYWNSALVERRLAEAQLLAVTGNLKNGPEQEISQRLSKQTAKARASVHELGAKDLVQAAALNARLEATIQTNKKLIVSHVSGDRESNYNQSLESQAVSIRSLQTELESDWELRQSQESDEQDLANTASKLEQRLTHDQEKLEKRSTDTSMSQERNKEIQLKLDEAKKLISKNKTSTSTDTRLQKLNDLQQAIKLQREVEILNQSEKSTDRSILKSLYTKSKDVRSKDKNSEKKSTSNSEMNK